MDFVDRVNAVRERAKSETAVKAAVDGHADIERMQELVALLQPDVERILALPGQLDLGLHRVALRLRRDSAALQIAVVPAPLDPEAYLLMWSISTSSQFDEGSRKASNALETVAYMADIAGQFLETGLVK